MKRFIYWGIAIAHTVASLIYLGGIDDAIVPTHYNILGIADAYGSKWLYLFPVPLPLALLGAFEIYRIRTLKNEKIQKNRRMENLLIPGISIFFVGICWTTLLPLRVPSIDGARMGAMIVLLMGVMMAFISNYLGKLQPNETLGIRCKWTLADDEVWRRTHRFGAITGMIGSAIILLFAVLGFFLGHTFAFALWGLLPGLFLVSVLPVLYARKLYKGRHAS